MLSNLLRNSFASPLFLILLNRVIVIVKLLHLGDELPEVALGQLLLMHASVEVVEDDSDVEDCHETSDLAKRRQERLRLVVVGAVNTIREFELHLS